MRQGQQNRRGRGRGRKPQNPLARNFESNGPDVKIRGTAAHIAEKYTSLARDALAAGDIVGAENYLQHAEHYNRIIMAAQAQQQQQAAPQGNNQAEGANGNDYRGRQAEEDLDEENGADAVDSIRVAPPAPSQPRGGSRGRGRSDDRRRANGSEHNGGERHDGNGMESSEAGQGEDNASETLN